MKINYTLTEEDYLNFSLYHAKNSTATRNSLRKQRLIFPLLFLIVSYFFAWLFKQPFLGVPLVIFSIVSILWLIFYPKYFYNFVIRHARNMLNEAGDNGLLGEHQMTFSEKSIVDSTSKGKTKMEWTNIKKLEENDDYFYIYSSPVIAYILPKKAVSGIDETRNFINSHIKEPS